MSEEDNSQDKTEQPSEKRKRESREKGQVVRSKDFNAMVILIVSGTVFLFFGNHLTTQMSEMMHRAVQFDRGILLTPFFAIEQMMLLVKSSLWALIPLLIVIFMASLCAPLLIGGWVFSGQQFQPKLSRLDPIKGLQRIVSLKGLVEMLKSFLKFILILVATLLVLKTQLLHLFALTHSPIETAITTGVFILIKSYLIICASLILIAAIDVPFQLFEHGKALKMTKQELRDEYKETEGKPEIKSAIRRAQQEIARRRMMSEVPKANVILTNPTHYAVAISYRQKGNKAPIVVAKGKDLIAFQINKIANEHKIPILSVPPLARAVYYSTKLNAEIPRGLYVAVAQVLAYLFQLRDKTQYDHQPEILQNLPIPTDLAREEDEGSRL